jgi:hypothetical protein
VFVARAGVVSAIALSLAGSEALAAEPSFELEWRAPAGCPDAAAIRADILRLTAQHATETLSVSADVSRSELGQWVVELAITQTGEPRVRRVEGKTCREVSDAAALIVAIALAPDALGADAPPPAPAPTPAPAKPEPRPKPRPPPPAHETRERAVHFGVGMLAGIGVTALPEVAPGASVFGALDFHRVDALELRAVGFLSRDASVAADRGAHVSLYALALRYCRWIVPVLAGCGGVEAGFLRAEGYGSDENREKLARWLAPEVGAESFVALAEPFGLAIQASMLVPVVRDRIRIDTTTAHRPGSVDVRVFGGFALRGL